MRIAAEIVAEWKLRLDVGLLYGRPRRIFRVPKDYLINLPFHGQQPAICTKEHVGVATGGLALSLHELGGVETVDGAILGHQVRRTYESGQRWQPVHRGKHLLGDDTRRDRAGRPDNSWHSMTSLKRRVHKIAAPRAVRTWPKLRNCAAACVITAENDDCVVVDSGFLDGVKNLPDVIVHLTDDIGV